MEKMEIRWCKVWRVWQMLKNLSFELFKSAFGNYCNMGLVSNGVVTLLVEFLQLNCIIYAVHLGNAYRALC